MKEVTVNEEIKELKAENEYFKDQLNVSVKASRQTRLDNKKLITQVKELKQKLEEVENQKLQSSGPEISVEVMKLKTQLANREQEIQQVRMQLAQNEETVVKLKAEMEMAERMRAEQEAQKTATLDVNKKVHELENALKLRERTIADNEKMIMDLESRISSLGTKEIVDVHTQLKEKNSKILELEKSVADLNKECDEIVKWGRAEEKEKVYFNDLYYAEQTEHAKHRSSCNHRRAESVLNLVLRSKELLTLLPQETSEQLIMQLRSREIAAKNTITRAAALVEQLPSIEKHSSASQALLKDLSSEDNSLCNLEKETVSLWNTCVSKVRIIKEEITALKEKTSLLQADLDVERAKVSQLCKKTPLLANLYVSANSETAQKLKQLTSENEELKSKVSSLEQQLHHSSKDAVASVNEMCRCKDLLKQTKEFRVNLADAKAKITQLEMQLQVKNLPAQRLIEDLKEQLKTLKETNAELRKDNRRLMKSAQETTFRECPVCQMRLRNLSNAGTQTTISSSNLTEKVVSNQYWLSGAPSGIVQEYTELTLRDRVRQLETEKEMLKQVCRSRNAKIDELQKQLFKPKAPEMKEQENMEPNNQQVGRPATRSQVKKMT